MKWIGITGLMLLAACGADGAPFVPTASTNLSLGTGGVGASTNLGVSNGIVSVGLGL